MKKYVMLLAAMVAVLGQASELRQSGRSVDELVPAGWERTTHATGDVNHDGIDDLVLLSWPDDEAGIAVRDDGFRVNKNAPVVAVYMGQSDGSYRLHSTDNTILMEQDEFFFIENEAVKVADKGVFSITYGTFAAAGSWSNETYTSTYRYQDGGIYLIGEDTSSFNRATLDTEVVSMNYLTGKRCTTVKKNSGRSPKPRWETVGKQPLQPFGKKD